MLRRTLGLVGAVLMGAASSVAAAPAPPAPYHPPPFAKHCKVRHFHEAQKPPIRGYKDDPLCVEYAKRDITVDNGGAVRFAAAEPARFAIAGRVCQYWQQDHWSIQLDRAFTPVARWDGSYWFDKGAGTGAVLLSGFRIAGQPVGAKQFADLVGTVSPALAAQVRKYGAGARGSGGGMSFSLGSGDPQCH